METLFSRHVIEHMAAVKVQHMAGSSFGAASPVVHPPPPHENAHWVNASSHARASPSVALKNVGMLATSHEQVSSGRLAAG